MRNLTTATTRTRTAGMTRKGESRALCYAGVAQLVEPRSCKSVVVGSSPIASSKKSMNTLNTIRITTASAVRAGSSMVLRADSSARLEHSDDNRGVVGSNPTPPTTEPLRERWRPATSLTKGGFREARGLQNRARRDRHPLTLPEYCTGGSTDLFTTGA